MVRLRSGRWLAWGVTLVIAAGCESRPARTLAPARQAEPAIARASRIGLGPDNIPPAVRITCPVPSPLIAHLTPPALRILWEGSDPDGQFTTRPVRYKYILLGPSSEFSPSLAVSNPDSLRRYYVDHPLGPWAGWDSTGADTTRVRFLNLIPDAEYVFAVIGFDEAGDYSPVFSLSSNILRLRVSYEGHLGPRLTLIGLGFEYQYPSGGWLDDPSRYVYTEVAENRRVTFRWFADPGGACQGVDVRSYRWVLDPEDLFDETPRSDEQTDLRHWSSRSLDITSATIGPLPLSNPPTPESHRFYIEVEDVVGARSLGIIQLAVVPAVNEPPECGEASAELAENWPPDGTFEPVRITGVIDPDGDPVTITVTGVTQDEELDGTAERGTCPDAVIVNGAAQVRRERSGKGDGRLYTIWFTADDGQGGTCAGSADVCMPLHRSHRHGCIKDDRVVNSLGPCGGNGGAPGHSRTAEPLGGHGPAGRPRLGDSGPPKNNSDGPF